MITTPQEYGYRIQLLNMAHAAHAACNCNWATKSSRGDAKSFLEVFLTSSAQKAARNTQNYHELLTELPTKPPYVSQLSPSQNGWFNRPRCGEMSSVESPVVDFFWSREIRMFCCWTVVEIPISNKRSCRNCCSSSFCDSAISVWHQGGWLKGEADGNPNLVCSLRVS